MLLSNYMKTNTAVNILTDGGNGTSNWYEKTKNKQMQGRINTFINLILYTINMINILLNMF